MQRAAVAQQQVFQAAQAKALQEQAVAAAGQAQALLDQEDALHKQERALFGLLQSIETDPVPANLAQILAVMQQVISFLNSGKQ